MQPTLRASWRYITFVFIIVSAAAFALACSAGAPGGETSAGAAVAPAAAATPAPVPVPTPRLSVNALMVTMIDNSGHVLWDAEKDGFAPKDEADWIEIEDHAMQLTAAGTLLQLGGTGQADMGWIRQVGWKENSELMSDAALAALSAAKGRNLQSLVAANGKLVESCEGCHKAFKPDAPTEGLAHQRPHSESHASNK
ncbi:MAG: hypothetical protein AB7N65_07475 [Vicinamibacterales bacterium]